MYDLIGFILKCLVACVAIWFGFLMIMCLLFVLSVAGILSLAL